MTTLVLIDLALVALGSFLEWAVKDKCQTFVFFTALMSKLPAWMRPIVQRLTAKAKP